MDSSFSMKEMSGSDDHKPAVGNDSRLMDKYGLTPREFDIWKRIAQGKSQQAIADDIHLSRHTVHSHRKNLYRKLGLNQTTSRKSVLAALKFKEDAQHPDFYDGHLRDE